MFFLVLLRLSGPGFEVKKECYFTVQDIKKKAAQVSGEDSIPRGNALKKIMIQY